MGNAYQNINDKKCQYLVKHGGTRKIVTSTTS